MGRRRLGRIGCCAVVAVCLVSGIRAADRGASLITRADLQEWLTYLSSDDLQGRAVFGTGIGLAASYIEEHLKAWGAKPAGDHGSYLQTVRVLGVKSTSRSSVTVEIGGETRTFEDGKGITLPKNMGGRQHFTVDHVEFVGYGLDAPRAGHEDYKGRTVKDTVVVWLGDGGPSGIDAAIYRRALVGRNRYATEQLGAAAAIGPPVTVRGGRSGGAGRATNDRPGSAIPAADFTTVQRLDTPQPPNVTADDSFFEFLFKHAQTSYADLKQRAAAQDTLPSFRLDGVRLTFNIDADYQIVRTQLTQNIVATIDGSDPQLKQTYVAFGAHYDHVGYAEGEVVTTDGAAHRVAPPGVVTPGAEQDRIWNGADDDGSGSVAVMALAKAFAEGTRPKRSLLFVWHVGEERGLWGSRYFADYPTVPMDEIVTQLNIDMIGRNRDNKASESNTVYLVGSDRISTELHEINRAANASLPRPMTLDYEYNDPTDLEQLYYRSDHYSYAAKGVPIIFFTTGLHPDYHANTDEVSKIEFDKMTRIVQMIYETGVRVANLPHAPVRDRQGARAGRQSQN
ncbi:MAG TPA: M28 family peptidase [Vicinamibacterales bacterium]|jgi:hypothetical protein